MSKKGICVKRIVKGCLIVLLLLGLLSTKATAQIQLQRGPHIQNTTTSSIQIAWETNNFIGTPSSQVRYGLTTDGFTCPATLPNAVIGTSFRDTTDNVIRHTGTVSPLSADTRYCYQIITIRDNGAETNIFPNPPRSEFSFKTFPILQPDFAFVLFGDSGAGCNPDGTDPPGLGQCRVRNTVRSIYDSAIGAVVRLMLHMGDVIYDCGEDVNYPPNYFLPYGNIVDLTKNLIGTIPMFPTSGNHDYGGARAGCGQQTVTNPPARPYLYNFALPAADLSDPTICPNPPSPPSTKRYYSFTYGNALFVALDTELLLNQALDPLPGACQRAWLNNELVKSKATWKFVYFHIAPFDSGDGHDCGSQTDRDCLTVRNMISSTVQSNNVDIVFSGHEHAYEITYPLMVTGTGLNGYTVGKGVYYVLTGGGGKGLNDLRPGGAYGWTSCFRGSKQDFYHATKVVINNDAATSTSTLTLQPVDINGLCPDGNLTSCPRNKDPNVDPGCPGDSTLVIKKALLQGTITSSSGSPIAGATVQVFIPDVPLAQWSTDCLPARLPLWPRMPRAQATTDANGTYTLSLLAGDLTTPRSTYSLLVTHPNYQAQARCGVVMAPNLRAPIFSCYRDSKN